MKNKLKSILRKTIIYSLTLTILYFHYTIVERYYQNKSEIQYYLEISREFIDIYYKVPLNEESKFKSFYQSFMKIIPFINTNKVVKINYINSINKKCENSESLNDIEMDVLKNSYLMFYEPPFAGYNYTTNYYSIFGYIAALALFLLLYKSSNLYIKNKDFRNAFKMYIILAISINNANLTSNSDTKIRSMKDSLTNCYFNKLPYYEKLIF